jgi:hypothetical protein
MADVRRTILEDVAEGRLTPEEAMERLEGLRSTPAAEPAPQPINRVRITGVVGTLAVIGEPGVAEASAIGAHRSRHEGDTLVIEAGGEQAGGWWEQRTRVGPGMGWGGLAEGINRNLGRWKTPLEVRINPDLPLEIDLTAGSVSVRDHRAPVKLDVNAGTVRLDRVTGPMEVQVGSGSVVAKARVSEGASRIRCELGNVTVHLEPGSNVQVTGRAHLGKLSLPGRERGFGAGLVEDTAVVGTGEATLDVETSAGAIAVSYA